MLSTKCVRQPTCIHPNVSITARCLHGSTFPLILGARFRGRVRPASCSFLPSSSSWAMAARSFSNPKATNTCSKAPSDDPPAPRSSAWRVERLNPARSATISALSPRRSLARRKFSPSPLRSRWCFGRKLGCCLAIMTDRLIKIGSICLIYKSLKGEAYLDESGGSCCKRRVRSAMTSGFCAETSCSSSRSVS